MKQISRDCGNEKLVEVHGELDYANLTLLVYLLFSESVNDS